MVSTRTGRRLLNWQPGQDSQSVHSVRKGNYYFPGHADLPLFLLPHCLTFSGSPSLDSPSISTPTLSTPPLSPLSPDPDFSLLPSVALAGPGLCSCNHLHTLSFFLSLFLSSSNLRLVVASCCCAAEAHRNRVRSTWSCLNTHTIFLLLSLSTHQVSLSRSFLLIALRFILEETKRPKTAFGAASHLI